MNYSKSATFDNGTEFVKHEELHQLGVNTYFADHIAQITETNKTSFDNLNQDDLNDIVWEINNRLRKVLNFITL